MKFSVFEATITDIGDIICGQLSICFVHRISHILYFLEEYMFSLSVSQIRCGENTHTLYILNLAYENVQILSKMKMFNYLCTKHVESCPQNGVINGYGSVKKCHIENFI